MQYILPQVEFAAPVWAPWMAEEKRVLERVQQQAVKKDIRSERTHI